MPCQVVRRSPHTFHVQLQSSSRGVDVNLRKMSDGGYLVQVRVSVCGGIGGGLVQVTGWGGGGGELMQQWVWSVWGHLMQPCVGVVWVGGT